jgi:hypothetical protein
MGFSGKSWSSKLLGFVAGAAACVLMLVLPAQAQFWDWGGRPRQQQNYNPFGGWFEQRPYQRDRDRGYYRDRGDREAPVDFSQAPKPEQKKAEATTNIVVLGDANADWLAYGLEDAFSERPEFGIVRKHSPQSGLIRYGGRGEQEWPQVAREIIAAEKPKFIVMMIGNNDRQQIREKVPPAGGKPAAAKPPPAPAPAASGEQPAAAPAPAPQPVDAEQQVEAEPPPANLTPEQARQAAYGPWEFHSEKWELAYIKRVDATIAALKSAGVPVLWVGLPSQRVTKASSDSQYLNEIYRSRADKAGITYVDIWDGFVDEAGRFSPQGPDYEGQIRRLRTGDGVYFTKFGARKLAHYVEREIDRHIANRGLPVALPVPVDPGPQAPNAKPGSPAQRPAVGPVVPLTTLSNEREELVGGGRAAPRSPQTDPAAARVMTKGEPIHGPSGRGDDFSWPRGSSAASAEPAVADPAAIPAPAPANAPATGRGAAKNAPAGQKSATNAQGGQLAGGPADAAAPPETEAKPQVQRRARPEGLRLPQVLRGLFR